MALIKKRNGAAQRPAAGSLLAELVSKAASLQPEWQQLNTVEGRKLSGPAFVAEAITGAGSTPERIQKLLEALRAQRPDLDQARGAWRRMIMGVRSPQWPAPPREFRRVNLFLDADGKTIGEVGALGFNSLELFAAAAVVAAKDHPEAFGTQESSARVEARTGELLRQRVDLLRQIAEAVKLSDLEFLDRDQQGRVRPVVKLGAGAVDLLPRETVAERLVAFWLASSERK